MKTGQSYIITGSSGDTYKKAVEMAMEATGSRTAEHADIAVIRKGDGKSKNVTGVDQVRSVISDSIVMPHQAQRKVYIFADGDSMNESAQNAALKLLEEPPSFVVILLCASRADCFLPTVRSRCTEINLGGTGEYEPDQMSVEFMPLLAKGRRLERFRWLEAHNKISIPEAQDFCSGLLYLSEQTIAGRRDSAGLTRERLLAFCGLMEKCLDRLSLNVTVKQLFGLLEIF